MKPAREGLTDVGEDAPAQRLAGSCRACGPCRSTGIPFTSYDGKWTATLFLGVPEPGLLLLLLTLAAVGKLRSRLVD